MPGVQWMNSRKISRAARCLGAVVVLLPLHAAALEIAQQGASNDNVASVSAPVNAFATPDEAATPAYQARTARNRAAFLDSELRRAAADVQKLRAALKDERRKTEKLFATLDLEREANLQAQATISEMQARGTGGAGGGAGGAGGAGGGGGGGGGAGPPRDLSASYGVRATEAGGVSRSASVGRMSFAAALATPGKGER